VATTNRLLVTALACEKYGVAVRAGDATDWLTDPAGIRTAWDVPAPPDLYICSGDVLALWRIERVVGAYTQRLYELRRPDVWPPVMQLPDGDWIFGTAPAGPDVEVPPGVSYLPPGTGVLAPPSPRGTGRARWLWSPRFPAVPLPDADAVLALAAVAGGDSC
jgi:hypothetical protein